MLVVDLEQELPGEDYSGKYIFSQKMNGKPSYRHEVHDHYVFYDNGWEVGKKASYEVASTMEFLVSKENSLCPIDVKNWRNNTGSSVDGLHIHAELDVNHMLRKKGIHPL